MAKRLALVVLATAFALGATSGTAAAGHYNHLLAPTAKCGRQTDTSRSTSDQERSMRCMHNYARTRIGIPALRASSLLQNSSGGKTADMLRCRQFSHNACNRSMTYHFWRVGYLSCRSYGVAENIAWGPGRYASVRTIMSAWLHSDGHRHNLLRSSYRDAGFGLQKGSFNGHRGSGVWTAHFGWRGC